MNITVPMNITFSVVSASITEQLSSSIEGLCSEQSINLILRANHCTMIRLSSGEPLEDVDVHFRLSSKWKTPEALDQDLQPGDVGLLTHTRESHSNLSINPSDKESIPFIHGAGVWPANFSPDVLLQPTVERVVILTFPSVQENMNDEEPFIWECNRTHAIRISRISLTAIRRAAE